MNDPSIQLASYKTPTYRADADSDADFRFRISDFRFLISNNTTEGGCGVMDGMGWHLDFTFAFTYTVTKDLFVCLFV